MKADVCNAYSDNERCGGCLDCLLMQAEHAAGLQASRAQKAEDRIAAADQRIKELEEREQELIAKCIQKNSEYQVVLRMAQTYKEAARLKNRLNENQTNALYWMNKALDLNNQLTRAQQSEQGIRNEAQGYRDDHLKLVDWLCDNGFGDSCGNPADDVLDLATLYLAKIKILTQFNDAMASELSDVCKVAGNVLVYRGWKSKQYEKGLELRTDLITIDNQISQKKKLLPHGV